MAVKRELSSGDTLFTNTGRKTRLTYLEEYGIVNHKRRVTCKCECGVVKDYVLSHINSGATVSCGCYQSDLMRLRFTGQTYTKTHGHRNSKEYSLLHWAKAKCYNPNCRDYYGGKIKVSKEWLEYPEKFFDYIKTLSNYEEWSASKEKGYIGELYALFRIDKDLDYEPGNLMFDLKFTNKK
jgi:hypothetical protein